MDFGKIYVYLLVTCYMTVQSAIFYITKILGKLCLFLVTCCMTVQSAIFYITKIVDSAAFVYIVYHVIWYLPIKFEE